MSGVYAVLVFVLFLATTTGSENVAQSKQCFRFTIKDDENLTKVDIEHDESSQVEVSETAITSCTGRRLLSVSIYKNGQQVTDVARRADYEFFPGLGYYKLHTVARSWSEAEATCRSEGSHLIVVNSQQELNVTKTFYGRNPTFVGATWTTWIWVGIHKVNGNFTSVLGQLLSDSGYTTWKPGNPSGSGDCVTINPEGLLDDDPCNNPGAFICEDSLSRSFTHS